MAINQSLLGEFDHEMATTRKTLERVPSDKFDYTPHTKSMKMGALSKHIAEMPGWIKETLEKDELDIAPSGGQPPEPPVRTREEVLALFDKNVAAGRKALVAASDDAHFMKPWSLKASGQNLFTMPRIAVLRSFVMNHVIHHRAQLGVYLRLNDIPLPATYGPSADENKF